MTVNEQIHRNNESYTLTSSPPPAKHCFHQVHMLGKLSGIQWTSKSTQGLGKRAHTERDLNLSEMTGRQDLSYNSMSTNKCKGNDRKIAVLQTLHYSNKEFG